MKIKKYSTTDFSTVIPIIIDHELQIHPDTLQRISPFLKQPQQLLSTLAFEVSYHLSEKTRRYYFEQNINYETEIINNNRRHQSRAINNHVHFPVGGVDEDELSLNDFET